jgi:hypothetical protein
MLERRQEDLEALDRAAIPSNPNAKRSNVPGSGTGSGAIVA